MTQLFASVSIVCIRLFQTSSYAFSAGRSRGGLRSFQKTSPKQVRAERTTSAMSAATEHHEVVIVGGGTAGLFTARKLAAAGVTDVIVLEGRGSVGGRVSTTYDSEDNPLFNNFAWRVGEVNTMMIALCKELGLNLIPQVTPPQDKDKDSHDCRHGTAGNVCKETEAMSYDVPPNRAPLSDFAKASLDSAAHADRQDRESGYAGRTAQISWPDETHGINAFVVEGGMDSIPREIAATLPEGWLRVNHRVSEVETIDDGYCVSVVKRDGNNYTPYKITCKTVVLAAPPYSLRRLAVAENMLPALYAVHERRLGHAYVKCKSPYVYPDIPDRSDVPDRIYRNLPDSILQQIISGDYGKGIFQAAYACDRFERVWREVQFHGPEKVNELVKSQLKKIEDMKEPPEGWDETIEEIYVRIGFVHRWHIESHVSGKNKKELSLQALTPNPAKLPGLYLAGEAFSPDQGWTEGALWTAEKVADMIVKARNDETAVQTPLSKHSHVMSLTKEGEHKLQGDDIDNNFMVYRGIVVDVSDWARRHPGGVGMIKGHVNENISELFDNFHGGWPAPLATLFGLQVGCTTNSQ